MKKVVVFLVLVLVFSMMGISNAYALDFGENMNIASKEVVILMVLQVIFLFIGAGIAGIDHKTFGKAMLATLGIIVFFFFLSLLSVENNIKGVGLVVMGALSVVVIQKVFDTTFTKALGAFFFSLVGETIAILFIPGI